MTIDWTKPIESYDGSPARVISDDYRVAGAKDRLRVVQVDFERRSEVWYVYSSGSNEAGGKVIRNRKVKHEGWVNLHRDYNGTYEGGAVYKSEELARKEGRGLMSYVATVKLEWEE